MNTNRILHDVNRKDYSGFSNRGKLNNLGVRLLENNFKHFHFLVLILSACLYTTPTYSQNSQDTTGVNALYNKIISLDDKIRNNPSLQVSNFNPADTASLPIGIVKEIGDRYYIICVDSAYFTPQGAFFNVYMAMHVPNSPKRVAFAAKGIQFNPQGVIVSNGARLELVSQQVVKLGPKLEMKFKNDGQNYIEWDCNGYKQAGMSVDFVFNSDMLINVSQPNVPVKASMAMVVQDVDNITFQLSQMDKFKVKNAQDFIFDLQNITIDRSENTTPQGVTLPFQTLQSYNGDVNAWKGFYAQNATITLPEKLSASNQPTQIYAQNLIIDDAGVSGSFGATNVFSTSDGSMNNKWGFSLDNIQVDLVSNHVTGGSISGTIEVAPLDDQPLSYTATVTEQANSEKLDYTFAVSPGGAPISISAFQSEIELYPSSQFIVQTQNDKFVPSAILNGSWTLDHSKSRMQGFTFQSLTIGTQAPFFTSGLFTLTQDTSKLMRFPISVTSVGITQTTSNDLAFTVGLGLNLGGSGADFSVNTTVRVISQQGVNNPRKLDYDRFEVDNIAFDLATNAFHLQGVIAVKSDDPVFGDLFFGNISLSIEDVIDNPIMVSAGFGKMPNYKYWFTDAAVPTNIPIGNVNITSIYGGVQNRVQSTFSDQQQLARVAGNISPSSSAVIPFTPDENQGLQFRAGVGLTNEVESVFNGEVMLTVAFNPNGGFQSINMMGQAYMMVTRAQRSDNNARKVFGQVSINYDHTQKVLDAALNASIYFPNSLSGNVDVTLHVDPTDWYFWLNRPTNRANVNIKNGLFYANAYFMVGTQIDPIPSPPNYITNAFAASAFTPVDFSPTATGDGFAMGVEIGSNIDGEFPSNANWRAYVAVQVGLGFDLLMMNASNYHCSGSSDPVGMNGYYCQGQVYAYLNGSLGVKKYNGTEHKATYPIGGLQVAAILQGKFPKPTYMYGAVNLTVSVLGISRSFTVDVEYGNNCTLVAN